MKIKSILCVALVLTILMSLCSCMGNNADKIVGKWCVGDDVYEFTADGKFIDLYNSTTAGYYKLKSSKKIAIYPDEDMKQEPVELEYSFKDGNLYLGALEYTPFEQ